MNIRHFKYGYFSLFIKRNNFNDISQIFKHETHYKGFFSFFRTRVMAGWVLVVIAKHES